MGCFRCAAVEATVAGVDVPDKAVGQIVAVAVAVAVFMLFAVLFAFTGMIAAYGELEA